MNNKERLEEIKQKYQWAIKRSLANRIDDSDIEWLIEQAERAEELELEINNWRAEVQKWQKFYEESEQSHLETKGLLKGIVNQNKRYRVALENICISPFPLDIDDAFMIAKQALEGEE